MIRTTLLLLVVIFFSFYAWRNWFVSTCAAILLMAAVQHPDFPNTMLGIQGLNPWNILLFSIIVAWLSQRQAEGLVWDVPPKVSWMFLGFFGVLVIGVIRLLLKAPPEFTVGTILSEQLINSIKWVIPGLLLFDACRTRRRVTIALVVILALYLLLALEAIRYMPLGYAVSGEDLAGRASKIIETRMGYNRVNLSMLLAGACWAILSTWILVERNLYRLGILAAAGAVALGQALTGGRTGYATWAVVGLTLSVVRWRRFLLIIPVAIVCVTVFLPGVRDRMLQGFGGREGNVVVGTSVHEITSGRNVAWPRVIDEIGKAPLFGYGRAAMITTGLRDELWDDLGESFPHPHEAYLEQLLDNGVVGFCLVLPIYFFALFRSFRLLLDRSDPLVCVVGSASFALVLALFLGSFGAQTFYPREGSVGMWAAIALMFRVFLERSRSLAFGGPIFPDDEPFADADDEAVPNFTGESVSI
jgi:O-antigen ligase